MNINNPIHDTVMDRIRKGAVSMRPRWQYVLLGLLWGFGALLVLLVLLYLASLAVFLMRQDGIWLAPALGARGWFDVLRSAPLFIILLVAACAIVLNALVRRSAFAYRRPITLSLGVVLLMTLIGGVAVGVSPFHREIHRQVRFGHLPPPFGMPYEHPFRPPMPDDVHRGVVILHDGTTILLRDGGGATTTIHLTPQTRLPLGADFEPGDMLVVFGDQASGSVQALGIVEVDTEDQ